MKVKLSYVFDELLEATCILASGKGTLKERLEEAYIAGLFSLEEFILPIETRDEWDSICESFEELRTADPSVALAVSLKAMSQEQASEVARRIVQLLVRTARLNPETEIECPGEVE